MFSETVLPLLSFYFVPTDILSFFPIHQLSFMIFFYNLFQIFTVICFLPFLALLTVVKKQYRTRILTRLGFGLGKKLTLLQESPPEQKTIWIHALSVGEVTSALPLVRALRKKKPELTLVFSAATRTGRQTADTIIAPFVDLILDGPLDFLITIKLFLTCIRPQLFILVETDFWPNWLLQLQKFKIPALLVNGRISKKSYDSYQKFNFFFKPMFNSFATLSMQTKNDAENMRKIGLPASRIVTLGNLKFDTPQVTNNSLDTLNKKNLNLPESTKIVICGSTHRGEEAILLAAFKQLLKQISNLIMIIAPRDIARAHEISLLAGEAGLTVGLRSQKSEKEFSVLILDTIGELAALYRFGDIAFVGGSLVEEGGHNPLEPAANGIPTLFGPHMEDFLEIAADIEQHGGAKTIHSQNELQTNLYNILSDNDVRDTMSKAAHIFMRKHSGVTLAHIQEIEKLLH